MKTRVKTVLIAAIVTISFMLFTGSVTAAPASSFEITTGLTSIDEGDSFTVTVTGKDIQDLHAYELNFTYDKAKLEFVNAVSKLEGFKLSLTPEEGKITFALAKLGDQSPESGEAELCTLTFRGKAAGKAQITLSSVKLMDEILASTDYNVNKAIEVSIKKSETPDYTSPEPTTTPATPTPTPTPTPIPAVTVTQDDNTITFSTQISATVDEETGIASARIKMDTVLALIYGTNEMKDSAQKTFIEIEMEKPEGTEAAELEIPGEAIRQISENTDAGLVVETGIGTMTFNTETLGFINSVAAGEDIIIGMQKVDNTKLPEDIQKTVGERPIFDLTVKSGETIISDFGGGKVEIIIPYTLQAGEDEDAVIIYYIDESGNLKVVRGRYDSRIKAVKFTVTHFSKFMIGYNEVSFIDVAANAWYKKAVGFMAARGVTRGVGEGRFAPDYNVTRADFLIMIMRAYNIEPDETVTDNFVDAGDKYYTPYLGTAKRMGLVLGIGDNKYAPEENITRQDMFVILYRILDKLNELPVSKSERSFESFNDTYKVADYAKEAMKLFVETGIVSGDGKNNLIPRDTSTRAQAAQVLYNLLSQ
jgi:hypothetical protein